MIRKLEKKDINRIVQLEEEIFGESLGYDIFMNEMDNPLIRFRVLEENNEIIGYIGGCFYFEEGEIYNFLIDKKYQHKGYGTMLITSLLDEIKKDGIKVVTLEVRHNNVNAYNFYLKFGFKEIAIRKHYYKNGDHALVMMKELV